MRLKAKLEVEFEFDVDAADSLGDAQYQGRVFLQTQLHRDEDDRQFTINRYEIDVIKDEKPSGS